MRRWAFLFIFCLASWLFILDIHDTVSAQETVSSYILADLQYEVYPSFSRIIFASNERIDYISYELQDPYRIVIDLIGVAFCELEEHAEYNQGQVKYIDIIETPYVNRPQGLDEFFYAVDYIVITPVAKLPYTVSPSADGKIVAIDIGERQAPALKVSRAAPLESGSAQEEPQYAEGLQKETEPTEPIEQIEAVRIPEEEIPYLGEHNIIDNIQWEPLDEASLLVISTNSDVGFKLSQRYHPQFSIIIKPKQAVFTDLEKKVEINGRYFKLMQIVKDKTLKTPQDLNEYFYPVRYIYVEPAKKLPLDFYSNEDGTISILEIYSKKAEKTRTAAGLRLEREDEEMKLATRKEILEELKEDVKREGLLKYEAKKKEPVTTGVAEYVEKELLKEPFVSSEGILSLNEAQGISIKSSPQANTAKEEVKLARLKKREAYRALFPQVKIKGSFTTGDVLGSDFIEEVYGVQAEHPLYQGGKLWNTYKQSNINLKLAKARYVKIENDLDFKVAEAYYNTVTAVMNIRLQEELLQDAEKILKLAEKRYNADLSTDLEILNAKSQYNQIQFQIATSKRDLALSRFKLQQAMNLDISEEEVDLARVDTELKFEVIEVDLAKCLELMTENQPDILVNKLLVESNEYGEKIAKAREKFKIDLTGFYGKADSYYDTEEKNLQRDWNIGVKVSRPFWGQGLNYSFTKERTSRKVGQTDRTGSESNVGEFSIMDKDAMAAASEIKEAKVNRQKAENDLMETRRQMVLEVKEAYYNYQESVLQVKNSLEKVRFQEEAIKVARAQAGLNEALQSQLLEVLTKLADEKALYVKALSDYNQALAKLNKAIGIKDYFRVD